MKIIVLALLMWSSNTQAFNYKIQSKLKYFPEVVRVTNCVLANEQFLSEVSLVAKFTSSSHNGYQVVDKIKDSFDKPVVILTERRARWSTVLARRVDEYVIFNTRKNPRSVPEMVNTLVHESLHVAGYGHEYNYSPARNLSVPYYVGDIAEEYTQDCLKEN